MRTLLLPLLLTIALIGCTSAGTTGGQMPPPTKNVLIIGLALDDYSQTHDAVALAEALGSTLNVPGVSTFTKLVEVYQDYKVTGDHEAARAAALKVLGFDDILVADGVVPDPLILQVAKRLLRDDPELDADLVARLVTLRLGLVPATPPDSGSG